MAITYHSGRRIQATSTDFGDNGAGIPAVSGGWKEVARHTLGSNTNPILASSIPDKKYYMVLYHTKHSSGSWNQPRIRFGNGSTDAGGNYAHRYSFDFGSDTATATNTYFLGWAADNDPNQPLFGMFYATNISNKEKLVIHNATDIDASGTTDAPRAFEQVAKWTNTSNVIDRIELNSASGSSNFTSGDEIVVLGWDPDDTHTTNFWEQLGTATANGSSNTLSTSITSKKYLWIQGYTENTSGSVCPRVGNSSLDSGSNYATRLSSNGGSQDVSTGATEITGLTSTTPIFWNMFIKNISGDEKLIILHAVRQNTAGSSNAPNRVEIKSKWVNTSNQIDTIGFVSTTGGSTINSNSFITVWGSN